jgi:hypothetical protein
MEMANNRKTNLAEVLFKVEQRPIFIKQEQPMMPSLFDEQNEQPYFSEVERFQAVVDIEQNYVFFGRWQQL